MNSGKRMTEFGTTIKLKTEANPLTKLYWFIKKMYLYNIKKMLVFIIILNIYLYIFLKLMFWGIKNIYKIKRYKI
jgi:hypothetical protein